jgi:histidinol-phosphatase
MSEHFANELALAIRLANEADAIALDRFRALDLVIDTKPDLTPVSDADRAVEAALRSGLTAERPDDAILGEEFGTSGQAARRWILDPIDGTKNYVRGVPVWATLIALAIHSEVVVGLVSAPALGMRWWASKGSGAWASQAGQPPRRLTTSNVARLSDSSVSYSDVAGGEWTASDRYERFSALLRQSWRTRAYGDFWSHTLVAEGAVDVAVEPVLSQWDIAALIPIVTEAGGTITGIDGSPALTAGSGLSTNGRLHDQTVEFLSQRDH